MNESSLDPILREAMGPFSRVTRGFAATIFPESNNGTLALNERRIAEEKKGDKTVGAGALLREAERRLDRAGWKPQEQLELPARQPAGGGGCVAVDRR